MNPSLANMRERLARAWAKHDVFADQRPVEVARDGLDVAREIGRELEAQPADCGFVRKSTSAWMSLAGSCLNDGMTPFGKPFSTYLFGSTIDS